MTIHLTAAVAQVYRGEKWGQNKRQFFYPVVSKLVLSYGYCYHYSLPQEQQSWTRNSCARHCTGRDRPSLDAVEETTDGRRQTTDCKDITSRQEGPQSGPWAAQHLSPLRTALIKDPKPLHKRVIGWIVSTSWMVRQSQQNHSLNKHTFYIYRWWLLYCFWGPMSGKPVVPHKVASMLRYI